MDFILFYAHISSTGNAHINVALSFTYHALGTLETFLFGLRLVVLDESKHSTTIYILLRCMLDDIKEAVLEIQMLQMKEGSELDEIHTS